MLARGAKGLSLSWNLPLLPTITALNLPYLSCRLLWKPYYTFFFLPLILPSSPPSLPFEVKWTFSHEFLFSCYPSLCNKAPQNLVASDNHHFITLADSVGQEFKQSTAGSVFLCAVISRTEMTWVAETGTAGVGRWTPKMLLPWRVWLLGCNAKGWVQLGLLTRRLMCGLLSVMASALYDWTPEATRLHFHSITLVKTVTSLLQFKEREHKFQLSMRTVSKIL